MKYWYVVKNLYFRRNDSYVNRHPGGSWELLLHVLSALESYWWTALQSPAGCAVTRFCWEDLWLQLSIMKKVTVPQARVTQSCLGPVCICFVSLVLPTLGSDPKLAKPERESGSGLLGTTGLSWLLSRLLALTFQRPELDPWFSILVIWDGDSNSV